MPVTPPPPLFRDLEFLGSILQAASLVGYVVADYSRGFVDGNNPGVDTLFIAIAWCYLASALLFLLAHGQHVDGGLRALRAYPHLTAEALNIASALCYCVSTALYTVDAHGRLSGLLGDVILAAEYAAALFGFFSSLVYVRAWELDDVEANEGAELAAAEQRARDESADSVADITDELHLSGAQSDALAALLAKRAVAGSRRRRASPNDLCGPLGAGCARVSRKLLTVEVQSQLWNVAPSTVYVVASFIALWLHVVSNPAAIAADAGESPKLLKLDALKFASKGYVFADVCFVVNALIALVAWRHARSARLRELDARHSAASEGAAVHD